MRSLVINCSTLSLRVKNGITAVQWSVYVFRCCNTIITQITDTLNELSPEQLKTVLESIGKASETSEP